MKVFTGLVLIASTPSLTPTAVTAMASRMLRTRSSGSPGRTAPSRTAAIGGTVVARKAGYTLASSVTRIPAARATMIVRGSNTRPVFGSVKPTASKELEEALGQQEPEEEADDRRDDPHDERLDDHRAEHLAVRRPDRPQRRELARPLGDRDRERVRDDEGAHEERDPAEREQERPQERDELVRVRGIGGRLLAPGPHLCVRRQDLLDLGDELGVRHVRLRGDRDLVEAADLLEEALRGGQVEAGERRSTDREARAELDDGRDAFAVRAFRLHADRLADLEVLLARGLLVHHDLVAAGPLAFDQGERVEDRIAVRDREARGSARLRRPSPSRRRR